MILDQLPYINEKHSVGSYVITYKHILGGKNINVTKEIQKNITSEWIKKVNVTSQDSNL